MGDLTKTITKKKNTVTTLRHQLELIRSQLEVEDTTLQDQIQQQEELLEKQDTVCGPCGCTWGCGCAHGGWLCTWGCGCAMGVWLCTWDRSVRDLTIFAGNHTPLLSLHHGAVSIIIIIYCTSVLYLGENSFHH